MSETTELRSILATDCGSTTTKAILIQKKGDEYRLVVRGEAPTTVEAPFEDVTRGVLNAVMEVEELSGRTLLDGETIITPEGDGKGVDVYVSTSSAGGGLQMMVAGVVKQMTGESAERAALGAGAIVMDVLATNDGRRPHERIERIRRLRPDMILLSGGTDGGTVEKVVEIGELVAAARPTARLGAQYQLPIIYAGNKFAQPNIRGLLEEKCALTVVDNLRPVLEREHLKPARDAIHELFMEHVMAHAPGYKKLMKWTEVPIMPTPGAVGLIMQTIAHLEDISVIGVDIGGATTDVFSVWQQEDDKGEKSEVFNRTVSANLGMSYSVSNVLAEATMPNVLRWIPFDIDEPELRNAIRNKMIRPTTIPHSMRELKVEQGIAREALRLAFVQHQELAVGLKGVQQARTIADTFKQSASGATLIDMLGLDILVGSGGVLSHAPRRSQAAMLLIDAFLPEGVTRIAVDSIFMMPQLGVLSAVDTPGIEDSAKRAAVDVFNKDCLIRLGTCISPAGPGKPGKPCLELEAEIPGGAPVHEKFVLGDTAVFPFPYGPEKARAVLKPSRGYDVGAGPGKTMEVSIEGGTSGIIVDCRGRRPFTIPEDPEERIPWIQRWTKALDAYPDTEEE
ncbi:MAG: glutamate mutase L [Planctomycetota bacterium]|jgi:uncharacterized protein (TIGR01319 family)